jgi:tRNA (pseudouridine54-N1)-methyltransferase
VTRRFVVIGQSATASPDFSLVDIAGTSGRLDVLLRCLRAALLVSHGLRRDTLAYLVLLGGELAPRVLRVDGRDVRFVRPDERMLAILVQKALTRTAESDAAPGVFVEVRAGLSVARGGLDAVLADFDPEVTTSYVLEEDARDMRDGPLESRDVAVFVGDHKGFDDATRARLAALGAIAIGVGPISLHADDAITVVNNELDRRSATAGSASA